MGTCRRLAGLFALALAGLTGLASCSRETTPAPQPAVETRPDDEATPAQVHLLCGSCHAYPPADIFPKEVWKGEVERGFGFFEVPSKQNLEIRKRLKDVPSLPALVRYYEKRAPASLPLLPREKEPGPCPVRFDRASLKAPGQPPSPAVSNVNLAPLTHKDRLDLLLTDMRSGRILTMKPYEKPYRWRELGRASHPAHVEVVDLDGDGINDLLVADLGSFPPTDDKTGRVLWFRGNADGSFTPHVLLEGVGRVADVQAADFRGIGKLDLVVAVFGWQTTGEVTYLENRTTDWSHPVFVPRVLDDRHGAIHVPVGDIDGDGKPDFVALLSQEHETVVAFLNEGDGRFRKETLYTGPHPALGSTGIQLVDLDGDGKLDVLYTNGDVLDRPFLLKPFHGVHWLRNRGKYPFEHHRLTSAYGVHRAVAADFRGNGTKDVVAVSFLPAERFGQRQGLGLDSVIYLEQTAPGKFVRHSLETVTCDHATCAAGAWDGDGRTHFVTGNFCLSENYQTPTSVTLWTNQRLRERK